MREAASVRILLLSKMQYAVRINKTEPLQRAISPFEKYPVSFKFPPY